MNERKTKTRAAEDLIPSSLIGSVFVSFFTNVNKLNFL